MTITNAQRVERVRTQLAGLMAERATHAEAISSVLDACETEARRDPTPDEAQRVEAAQAERKRLDAEIAVMRERFEEVERDLAEETAYQRMRSLVLPAEAAPVEQRAGGAVVTSEARTYTSESARQGVSFFRDAYTDAVHRDFEAAARLQRHQSEARVEGELSQRAVATTGLGGLVVPQDLTDLVAPVLRNGRPFANSIRRLPLPADGMSLVIPRGTTGVSADVQATQNTAVSSTDAVYQDLTVPVVTIAGQQDLSRQSLERGTGVDALVFADLVKAHAAQLDSLILNGAGTGGTPLGVLKTANINSAAAFGAAVTATNFYAKIAGQIAAVAGQGAGVDADLIVMHPRRWGWHQSLVDTAGRPLNVPGGYGIVNGQGVTTMPGWSSSGDGDGVSGAIVVGGIQGLPVITDANIPTNVGTQSEDQVLVLDTAHPLLWEDGSGIPTQFRLEQTLGGQLTVKLVVYSYIAFTAGRYPGAVGVVGGKDATAGQGLIAPTF